MKICVIIAEYNPFHNGHLYHIAKAKAETECDTLIVLLSGSFSRRGEAFVSDRFTRANWAILAGADCVLELPTVFTLSSTKDFVYGALKTLKPLGQFTLSFGSESGNIETLESTVDCHSSEKKDFQTMFSSFMSQGFLDKKHNKNATKKSSSNMHKSNSLSAEKHTKVISKQENSFNGETSGTTRNVLGVEFIKASRALNMDINFHTVKLIESRNSENFLSSNEIRKKMKADIDFSKSVPPFVQAKCPNIKKLDALLLYSINNLSLEQLEKISNINDGFENKLKTLGFTSMKELNALASKQNSKSSIKRMAICATLGITKENLEFAKMSKPYFRVLALKQNRQDILSYLQNVSKNVFIDASDCTSKNKVKTLLDIDEKTAKLLSMISL